MAHSLRQNFSWLLVGNVVYSACQWGILVLLAKLGTPGQVGQFALGLAVTAPVLLFSNLQLSGVQATDVFGHYSFRDYLGLRLLTTILALTFIGILVAASPSQSGSGPVVLVVGVVKGLDAVSDIYFGLLQKHEMMRPIGIGMICNGLVSVAAVAVAMTITRSVLWAAVGSSLGSAVALLAVNFPSARGVLPRARDRRPRFTPGHLLRLARVALPLGIVMLLISLNGNVPRYSIQHYLGERPLGLFAAMAYVTVAGGTIVAALGQAAVPRMARYFSAADIVGYLRLLARLVALGACIGGAGVVVALLAGREVLTLLYRADYASDTATFAWITAAAAVSFVASFMGYGMTAAREFRAQAPLAAMTVATTAGASFLLVPRVGIVGAAWATGIGALVQLLGSLVVLARAVRRKEKGVY